MTEGQIPAFVHQLVEKQIFGPVEESSGLSRTTSISFARFPLMLGSGSSSANTHGNPEFSEQTKAWYARPDSDIESLLDHVPSLVAPHFFLASTTTGCYQCGNQTRVFSLLVQGLNYLMAEINSYCEMGEPDDEDYASEDEDDGEYQPTFYWGIPDSSTYLKHVTWVSGRARRVLAEKAPTFYPDDTKNSRSTYWLNHCQHCGAKNGDNFVHGRPHTLNDEGLEAPFNPGYWSTAEPVDVERIDTLLICKGELRFDGKAPYLDGDPDLSIPND